MPQPPKSPPSGHIEGRDANKPTTGKPATDAAEQEECARAESKGRPAGAKR